MSEILILLGDTWQIFIHDQKLDHNVLGSI